MRISASRGLRQSIRRTHAAQIAAGDDFHRRFHMRKYIDCREFPSDMKCSIVIAADNDGELLEAAVQHAVAVHKHEDTPDLRNQVKTAIRSGTPPA